ncbi:MAG: formylglycine-generating enzyme family protein, partial [Odoribacter sp.]|nr:formylglycine-generating enzyme family protein [Odoribacter sp.]
MYNEKVKSSRVFCCCKMAMVVLMMGVSMHLSVKANNVRLNGTVKVTDVTSGVATLELDLAWDNSWRDNFNWDAVWIFLKTKPASGAWSHVMLQDVQHTATNDYVVMNGKSGSNVVGVYVFLGKNDARRQASTTVTLKWACGSGYTKSSFDNNQAFLLAQGIEMVYVPFGAYYLGDGASSNTLGGSDGKPLAISGEGAITSLYQRSSNGLVTAAVNNLSANYPKGYGGFYVMKYETSQEQYVTFLNTLTRSEQETLLGASLLSSLSPGRYVFGDSLQPTFRNGIILSGKLSGQPYIFDNNLNGNDVYGEDGDGQCIACNYMSLNDMLAYASWSGLRPMSELEYERACRAPFPQDPVAGEYPWNSNTGVSRVTGLSAGGKETEVASNSTCNVNSGNGLTGSNQGPVRCGLFARSTSSQTAAGATYWGVMEMAGNVRELVAAVSHTSLSRTTNGGGTFSTSAWTSTPTLFGLRGGGFSGADSLLRTSNRSEMTAVASVADRNNSVGFRLTRTLDAGSVTVSPGTISLSGPLCPGIESTISETAAAGISGMTGNFPITYTWSYSIDNGSTWTVISGETANTLKYSAFVSGKTYLFRRTAVCALGEASVQTTGIAASASTVITAQPTDVVNAPCNLSISVTATGTSLSYQWYKDGAVISGATSAT